MVHQPPTNTCAADPRRLRDNGGIGTYAHRRMMALVRKPLPFRHNKPGTIVYGAFKGMGDLLCAAPTIAAVLSNADQVILVVFPQLSELVDLIEFGPNRSKLRICVLPVAGGGPTLRQFLRNASQYSPDLIWVSPHAPLATTSAWKTSFMMWMLKRLYWRRAIIAGAASERLSWLFDVRVCVDRGAPYMMKEWLAYRELQLSPGASLPGPIGLIESIAGLRKQPPAYDLIIHPGALADNRKWPWSFYADVVARIPADRKIAAVGLPGDVAALRAVLPADRPIEYLTGSLIDAVKSIARSRVALTMDSGSMFFASSLRIPTIALFGPSNPASVLSPGSSVTPIFQPQWPCQPCGKPTCSQKSILCMSSIDPQNVADAVLRLLSRGD